MGRTGSRKKRRRPTSRWRAGGNRPRSEAAEGEGIPSYVERAVFLAQKSSPRAWPDAADKTTGLGAPLGGGLHSQVRAPATVPAHNHLPRSRSPNSAIASPTFREYRSARLRFRDTRRLFARKISRETVCEDLPPHQTFTRVKPLRV